MDENDQFLKSSFHSARVVFVRPGQEFPMAPWRKLPLPFLIISTA